MSFMIGCKIRLHKIIFNVAYNFWYNWYGPRITSLGGAPGP